MHRKTAALIACLILSPGLLPGLALAEDRGSEADQQACTPDVFRLCSDFIPNEDPIVACLKAKRPQLSSACGLVMFPAGPKASTRTRTAAAKPHRSHHRRLAREASND